LPKENADISALIPGRLKPILPRTISPSARLRLGRRQRSLSEPSTWAMMMLGFAGLGYAGYRKAKDAALFAA
jgi:hypothetical protein